MNIQNVHLHMLSHCDATVEMQKEQSLGSEVLYSHTVR